MKTNARAVKKEVDFFILEMSGNIVRNITDLEYCKEMSISVMGRLIVQVAARIYFREMNEKLAYELRDQKVELRDLPAVRNIVEGMMAAAKLTTEEGFNARN